MIEYCPYLCLSCVNSSNVKTYSLSFFRNIQRQRTQGHNSQIISLYISISLRTNYFVLISFSGGYLSGNTHHAQKHFPKLLIDSFFY